MTENTTTALLTFLLLILGLATSAAAQPQGTSNVLLLPSFEVDLSGYGATTFLSLVNSADEPAELEMIVYSNWGIEIFSTRAAFRAHEARAFNLADWLIRGKLPDRILLADELAHAQAALSGQASPKTNLYYGTEEAIQTAFGSVSIRRRSGPGAFFGDFFVFDPAGDNAQGDLLVDESPGDCEGSVCERHGLRFFTGGALGTDTEIVIRTRRTAGQPSESPFLLERQKINAQVSVYRQNGQLVETREMSFLPLEAVRLSELGFDAAAGWIDITTDEETFIAVRYSADGRFSVGLRAVCLSVLIPPPPPVMVGKVRIEKSTNGEDADSKPGPTVDFGAPVNWEYVVTNTGQVNLRDVEVTDDQGVVVHCDQDELAPGESMTCTGSGFAIEGQYENLGTVMAKTPDGKDVEDTDPSHYFGQRNETKIASIDIEKSTNDEDADQPTGPQIPVGGAVTWKYVVKNTGDYDLFDVRVTDSDPSVTVSCPQDALKVGKSMECVAHATAIEGQYKNTGTATGNANIDGFIVERTDTDDSHYFGMLEPVEPIVTIDIEKSTNGHDADAAPGPEITVGDPVEWIYRVTTTGNVTLSNIDVSDNMGVAVSCPKTTLAPQEWMDCKGYGTAEPGQYKNIGTATGDNDGKTATDSDPSHYKGKQTPQPPKDRRMTGGGSAFTDNVRYTHGFELHCDTSKPNNLEINWGPGRSNQFHLTNLASGNCTDDPSISEGHPVAGFDTFVGTGTGRLNGEEGATITFKLTDAGEPGKDADLAQFTIVPPGGGAPVVVSGTLNSGNHQAHGN